MSLLRRITLHGACLQTARASNVSLVAAMARCSTKPGIASSTNGDMKMARIVGIDLNRIKSEYARTTTPSQQKLALAEIGKTPLSKIQGLDVKLVAQLLSTLVSLDAPPGLDITEQCPPPRLAYQLLPTNCCMQTVCLASCARKTLSSLASAGGRS